MFSLRHFVLFSALILVAACDQKEGQEGQDPAAAMMGGGGPPPAVSVAQPLVMPIDEWREFSGRFEATETVEIRSRISGYLMDIQFTEGALVKKGDPLFVIDPRQIEAALRQRQADLKLAESQTEVAENNYERAAELFKTGDISEAILDQRKGARDSAQAAVDSARAGVEAARVDLVYTRITAPISGRISNAMVTRGNLINPGQDVLTRIVSQDPIHFYFDVDEKAYIAYTRAMTGGGQATGLPVMVALADEADYTHPGTMNFLDNILNDSSGTIRARAVLANPDGLMAPGMFGRARIRTGGRENGILIPDEAIMIDQSRKYVYVVDGKGIVTSRTIETGSMDKGLRVVEKGLEGTETIVVNGLQRAQEGAPVTPQKTTLAPKDGNVVPSEDPNAPTDAGAAISEPAPPADTPAETLPPAGAQ